MYMPTMRFPYACPAWGLYELGAPESGLLMASEELVGEASGRFL